MVEVVELDVVVVELVLVVVLIDVVVLVVVCAVVVVEDVPIEVVVLDPDEVVVVLDRRDVVVVLDPGTEDVVDVDPCVVVVAGADDDGADTANVNGLAPPQVST